MESIQSFLAAGPAATPPPASRPSGDLPVAPEAEASARLLCMSFRVGPLGLLFPSNDGREVVAPPPVSRIPNTVGWMRGLANVRGELVPVVDAARAFGVAREARAPAYLLIFGQGDGTIGLLIDGLPRLFNLADAQPLPAPADTPGLLAECVRGAYAHDGSTWLDLDLEKLFDNLARRVAQA